MTSEQILAFNAALLAALASPGPALLVALRTTLASGWRAGAAVGLGLGIVAALWTGLALLGLAAVFALVPWLYLAARILGAAYLFWIAIGMWRGADAPLRTDIHAPRRAFRTGLLINLANPKSVLFAAAVLVVIFPGDLASGAGLLVVVNHMLVEAAFYTALALVFSRPAAARVYLNMRRGIDRGASLILGALGLRLLLTR